MAHSKLLKIADILGVVNKIFIIFQTQSLNLTQRNIILELEQKQKKNLKNKLVLI